MKGKPLYISLLLFGLYSCALLGYAIVKLRILTVAGLWGAGLLGFTLVEYLFHRWLFHMATDTVRKAKLQYAVHGNHHAQPHEMTGVMMRPVIAVAVLVFTSLLFYALFGWRAVAILPGFLFGYSCYLFIHFAVHAFRPPNNVFRSLWRWHHLHHYYNDHKNYGVSSPLWDLVFGTYLSRKSSSTQNITKDETTDCIPY